MNAYPESDHRASKTRTLLFASFDRLLLARGYNNMKVRDLTADAAVGRSTFYEHFHGKEELLELSTGRFICVFAAAAATGSPSPALQDIFTHVSMQRSLAIELLNGSARLILLRALALELERCLKTIARRSAAPSMAPFSLLAMSLAHTQLGAVDAWLNSDVRCDANTAARVLHATTRAAVAAMFAPPMS